MEGDKSEIQSSDIPGVGIIMSFYLILTVISSSDNFLRIVVFPELSRPAFAITIGLGLREII